MDEITQDFPWGTVHSCDSLWLLKMLHAMFSVSQIDRKVLFVCSSRWVSGHQCSSISLNRYVLVCERNTCALVCKGGKTVTAVLLTHALQAMLFLQGLAAQWASGTAGERTWHQIMLSAAAAPFFFGLLPLLFLLLFFSVLTLQTNKECKHRGRFLYAN